MITGRIPSHAHGENAARTGAPRNRFGQQSPNDTPGIMDIQQFSPMVG